MTVMRLGGQVFFSLRAAARSVSADVSEATVDAVSHRYGEDAGATARDSLQVVSNVGTAAFNVSQMVVAPADIVGEVACTRSEEWLASELLVTLTPTPAYSTLYRLD